MSETEVRKIISDAIWEKLEPAVEAAKHSLAGAPGDATERKFIEAILYLNRTGCSWRDLPTDSQARACTRLREHGNRGWLRLPVPRVRPGVHHSSMMRSPLAPPAPRLPAKPAPKSSPSPRLALDVLELVLVAPPFSLSL